MYVQMITQTKVWSPKYIKNPHDSTPGRQKIQLKKWAKEPNRCFSKEDKQRVQRHIKGCSASLAIREMQIKTTLRYHFKLVRMAIITKSTNNKCLRGCGEKGTLVHCWGEMQTGATTRENSMEFPQKLKMELPFDPAIPLLRLYPKDPETPTQKNLYAPPCS